MFSLQVIDHTVIEYNCLLYGFYARASCLDFCKKIAEREKGRAYGSDMRRKTEDDDDSLFTNSLLKGAAANNIVLNIRVS